MSLRIRRGTDAQRQTLTFDQGEVVYTTDTKKVYVGDGITQGGVNILANSAGVGVTFNGTTQAFDFSTNNLGLTTSVISEGANKYYTTQRAQDAAASLFTSVGSPTSTGSVTGTITPSTIVLAVAPTNMVQGERIVISGTGGNGLSATTYYVVSVNSANVVLASTLANAMASTPVPISSLSTGSITGTTYAAGATDTGITFTYDSINHVMNVTASGVTSIVNDISPSLGGNLAIGNYNITSSGTGAISIAGGITTTATTASTSTTTGALIVGGGAGVAGNLNVGGTVATNSISGGLNVIGVSANTTTPLSITGIGDGTYTNTVFMSLRVAKGTIATPTTTAANDVLGGYNILGYNGSTYKAAAFLGATWDSTAVLTDVYPASIVTLQGSGGGSIQNKAILDAAGRWNAPRLKVTSYATGSYPTSPQAGEVIFDSTTKHFMGHNGTAWVAFTGP